MAPTRKDIVRIFIIGVVAAVVGTFASLQIDWFPAQGATQSREIDTLYDWLLVASVPMFVLVMSVAIYCVVRFRVRPGQENIDGAPIHGNARLEIGWVTVPFLIVTALAIYAAVVLANIEKKQPNELHITAIGQQFTWHFEYQNVGASKITSDVLNLPNNRPVYVDVVSRDVLHSFWVPAFRVKIDAVPGQTDHVRFTPIKEANYTVVCAELCGWGHSTMRVRASVMSKQSFDRWVRQKLGGAKPAAAAGGGATAQAGAAQQIALGKRVFTGEGGCGACHTLADAGSSGTIGPNLAAVHVAAKGAAYIKQSIETPNADVVKGFPSGVMPQDFKTRLGPQKIDALVRYLLQAGK